METPMSMFDLSGRVAVITGGNGGIGLGIAQALALSGCNVSIWGRNEHKNEAAAATMAKGPGEVATKLLPVAKHLIGLDPTRRRGESDGSEQPRYLLDRPLAQPVDDRPISRPLPRSIDPLAEHGARDRALATPRRPHDQAYLPRR